MSDSTETQSVSNLNPQKPYVTQPGAFRPGISPAAPNAMRHGTIPAPSPMKSLLVTVILVALVGMVVYQQGQINRLNKELGLVSDNLKSSDFKDRLDAHEAKLETLNTRLSYLDSKISASDEKAQVALNKLKAQEDNDIVGNAIKALKQTFGFQ